MVLISHVIKSKRVLNEENCQIYCYLEANCVSYNYGPAEAELYLCELSDKNHLQVSSDELEERHGFIYRPVTPISKLKQRCQRSIYHKPVLHAYYILLIVKVVVIEAIVVILELIVIRIYLKSCHWKLASQDLSS